MMTMMVITTQIPFVAGGTSDSMGVSDPAVEEGHPLTTNLWVFHFVENQKKIFRTAIENPNMYKEIFPNRCDRIWIFQEGHGWRMKSRGNCKIIDQEDESVFQECDN